MNNRGRNAWSIRPQTSIIATLTILFALILVMVILRVTLNWPSQELEGNLLLGIFVISLSPILVMLVNLLVEQGGTVEAMGVKINFSNTQSAVMSDVTIPANIGVPGQAVSDSATINILDALKKAVGSEIVVIDLETGESWWETRLLVLLAGAVRHNQPKIIVFVATQGNKRACFQGWATADMLLPNLLKAHPKYARNYYASLAATRQWEMVEPTEENEMSPTTPTWMQQGLALQNSWMAFEAGLPNPFYTEQLLASELGIHVERQEPPRTIGITRLNELFESVLHEEHIDEARSSENQLKIFFNNNDLPYIAITHNRQFKALVSQISVLKSLVSKLVQNKS